MGQIGVSLGYLLFVCGAVYCEGGLFDGKWDEGIVWRQVGSRVVDDGVFLCVVVWGGVGLQCWDGVDQIDVGL